VVLRRWQGATNKALKSATVNSNAAILSSTQSVVGNATLANGTNNVPVTVTDGSNATKTNNYQVSSNGSASATPTYDLNGNMTSDGLKTFKWDAENRLIEILYLGVGNKTSFNYDSLNRYSQLVEIESGAITSSKKVLWCADQRCEENDSINAINKQFFIQGQVNTSTKYFYCEDSLSSIFELTDAAANVQAEYSYDSYGKVSVLKEQIVSDSKYASYYFHTRSDLYMPIFRLYDSNLTRFLNRDLVEEASGVNLYRYAFNAPISISDPSGLNPPGVDLETFASRIGATPNALGNGCVDCTNHVAGFPPGTDPDRQPSTACFVDYASAVAYKNAVCRCGGVVFAKMGTYKGPLPKSGAADPLRMDNNKPWDYVTEFHTGNTKFIDMNHGKGMRTAQRGYFWPEPPTRANYPEYPDTIWCAICKGNKVK
jgi:RHS repeat-associated protein